MVASVTEQWLLILAGLARGELHGYGIARDVEELSDGRVRLTAGTLYGALNRMVDEGWVAPSGEEVVGGRRRRYYRITPAGETGARCGGGPDAFDRRCRGSPAGGRPDAGRGRHEAAGSGALRARVPAVSARAGRRLPARPRPGAG